MHRHSGYVDPLIAVSKLRYVEVGKRMEKLTKDNVNTVAYFYCKAANPLPITSEWLGATVTIPLSARAISEHNDWVIQDGWSLKKGTFSSASAGRSPHSQVVRQAAPDLAYRG